MHTQQNFFVYRPLLSESESQVRSLQQDYSSVPSFEAAENPRLPILTSQTWNGIDYGRLLAIIDRAPAISRKSFESEIVSVEFGPAVRDMTRRAINLVLSDTENNDYLNEHKHFKAAVQKADETVYVRPFTEPYIMVGQLDEALAADSILDRAKALVGQTVRISSTDSTVGKVRAPIHGERIQKPIREIQYEPVQTVKPGSIPQGLLNSLRPRE